MTRIYAIIRLSFLRLRARHSTFIPLILITILSMGAAGFFASQFELKPKIGVVSADGSNPLLSKYFNTVLLPEPPLKSELIRNKYDGVLTITAKGEFTFETFKGDELRELINLALADSSLTQFTPKKRSQVMNLFGYSLLFILLQGVLYLNLFTTDKETGTFARVLSSPLSLGEYVAGKCSFSFSMIYTTSFLTMLILKFLGVEFELSIGKYAALLIIPALLSTTFAFFMLAWLEKNDDALSFSASIIVLTSLVSGSFYDLKQETGLIANLVKLLPQKQFFNLIKSLESQSTQITWQGLIYCLFFSALLLGLGLTITTFRYKGGRYGG